MHGGRALGFVWTEGSGFDSGDQVQQAGYAQLVHHLLEVVAKYRDGHFRSRRLKSAAAEPPESHQVFDHSERTLCNGHTPSHERRIGSQACLRAIISIFVQVACDRPS